MQHYYSIVGKLQKLLTATRKLKIDKKKALITSSTQKKLKNKTRKKATTKHLCTKHKEA